jgi:oligo-1,6-glucosidase
MEPKRTWWKEAVVYQIYPRSFKDSNADGIGDLKGIIQRLDYIQSLGVDAVWLNPIYQSPYDDGGYDISDYKQIHHEFGTMDDFDRLLTGLHQRGLRLIMDLVVNHSSDEHRWFIESRKDVNNPYRDYYFWKPGKDQEPPNNWPSFFGGSAWQLDEPTGEYYLHLFSKKQPDLNWEHEPLRKEVADIMRFWLDKGVDGLRLDVISAISKRVDFPDSDTFDFNEIIRKYYANGPRLKAFIRELRHQVWNDYDLMTVGEGPGITPENALEYLNESDGLNMIFHFGHMFMDQGPGGRFDPIPWTLRDFKAVFKQWDNALHKGGWGSVFLGNHDFARMVSRWGNDHEFREPSAKLLITLLLSMRGTPFIFAGDELGMTNTVLTSIEESKDIETLNGWLDAKNRGMSETDFLKLANYAGRDNARTPFQWSDQPFAGFSSVTPWMPVNPNFSFINRDNQEGSLTSVLNYFRSMVELRKSNQTLVYGRYVPCRTLSDSCFAYFRENEQEKLLVVLNFSNDQLILEDSLIPSNALRLLGNYPIGDRQNMQPWEAVIYKL